MSAEIALAAAAAVLVTAGLVEDDSLLRRAGIACGLVVLALEWRRSRR